LRQPPLDRELAKRDPRRVFRHPVDILKVKLFTKGEKLGTLNRWRQSILEEMSATSEGMRTYGVSEEHARVLAEIEEAKRNLGGK
jgi:hypothetical protein